MRQHYIPQWLLRNFLDSNGKIYGFVTSNPAGGVFATAPKKLMVEKDLYTLRGESWPDEQAAEKEFSRREDLMKPVADKIILAARNNALPRLTLRERLFCLNFHYGTWARTRYIAAEKGAALGPFDKDAFLAWCRKEHNLDAHDMAIARDIPHDPDNERVTAHDSRVMAAAGPPPQGISEYLAVMGLRIARITKPSKSFVIGSYALAFATYRGENHFWLPISHDVAVEPYGVAGAETLVELAEDRDIRVINEASFRESRIVAARSERLLRSLADRFGGAQSDM